MLFDIFFDIMILVFDLMLNFIPEINIEPLDALLSGIDWMITSLFGSIQIFNYFLGSAFVLPSILAFFTVISGVELLISLFWFALHKTHIAGGGH